MSQEYRTKQIVCRVTPTEHHALMEIVSAANATLSDLLRERVLHDEYYIMERKPKASLDKKELIRLYSKASNNLNQLAHQANLHNQKGTVSQELMTRIALTLNSIEGLLKSGIEYVD